MLSGLLRLFSFFFFFPMTKISCYNLNPAPGSNASPSGCTGVEQFMSENGSG